MSEKASLTEGELVELFQKHLTPLYFTFRRGDDIQSFLYSAFPMEVRDHWYLVTAGHVLTEVEENIQAGYEVVKCRIIDTLAKNAPHDYPITFDYESEYSVSFDYDKGLDFGVLPIRDIQRKAMESNGVIPFNESTWCRPGGKIDFYVLLGTPAELSDVNEYIANFTSMIYLVKELDEKPERFPDTEARMFYGVLPESDAVSSIRGMSGGPILAFRWIDGSLRYWIHAVQSAWLKDTREIKASLTWPLAVTISDSIEEIEQQ